MFLEQGSLLAHEILRISTYWYQRHELLIFNYLVSKVEQIWNVAKEVTLSSITIFIGLKIMVFVMLVLLSIDMLHSFTNPVVAMQRINPLSEFAYFHHLKCLTRKRTRFDMYDTNIVVVKRTRSICSQKSQK